MPLTPATTDKFTKVGSPGSATTLSAPGYTTGVSTSIQVGSTTNWQAETKQIFAIDRAQIVNGEEVRIAGTYCEFEGIVTGANTISNVVKRLGTSQNYPSGSLTRVYIPVAATRENDMVDGLNQDHNGKGNHKNLTDDNGNEWLERNQTASAVNHPKITNAATGGDVVIEAAGDDANVNLSLKGKGTKYALTDGVSPKQLIDAIVEDFVVSGGAVAQTSGLTGSFSDIVYYINSIRYSISSVANKVYTASKDTYVDVNSSGAVVYTEVANNAVVGMTLAANHKRIAKVVTNGSAITRVEQVGYDPLGNRFYNTVMLLPSFSHANIANNIAYPNNDSVDMTSRFIKPKDIMTIGTGQILRWQPLLRSSQTAAVSLYRLSYIMRRGMSYISTEPASGTTYGQTANYQTINTTIDQLFNDYWATYDMAGIPDESVLRVQLKRDGAGVSDTSSSALELEGVCVYYNRDYSKSF